MSRYMVPYISNYTITECTLRSKSGPRRHFLPIQFSVDQQQWSQVTVTSFPSLRALNLFDSKVFKNSLTESTLCRAPEYPVSERQTSKEFWRPCPTYRYFQFPLPGIFLFATSHNASTRSEYRVDINWFNELALWGPSGVGYIYAFVALLRSDPTTIESHWNRNASPSWQIVDEPKSS